MGGSALEQTLFGATDAVDQADRADRNDSILALRESVESLVIHAQTMIDFSAQVLRIASDWRNEGNVMMDVAERALRALEEIENG